jgi:hypothetical protein
MQLAALHFHSAGNFIDETSALRWLRNPLVSGLFIIVLNDLNLCLKLIVYIYIVAIRIDSSKLNGFAFGCINKKKLVTIIRPETISLETFIFCRGKFHPTCFGRFEKCFRITSNANENSSACRPAIPILA